MEDLSCARHCTRHWGRGWEELNNGSCFFRHEWETQTCVHTTRAGKSLLWCWDKLHVEHTGERLMPSGDTCGVFLGRCMFLDKSQRLMWWEGRQYKGTIFCKSSSLEWKEWINWKLGSWKIGKRPPFVELWLSGWNLCWEAICTGNISSGIDTQMNLSHGSSSCTSCDLGNVLCLWTAGSPL